MLLIACLLVLRACLGLSHATGSQVGEAAPAEAEPTQPQPQPQRCMYSFIVNELDSSNCPTVGRSHQTQDDQAQERRQKNLFLQNLDGMAKRIEALETKLYEETVRNRELKSNILIQEQVARSAEDQVHAYQQNMTSLVGDMRRLKQVLQRQKLVYRNLDTKISGVMLDVIEVNNLVQKQQSAVSTNEVHKSVSVQPTSAMHTCSVSPNSTKYKDCEDLYTRGHTTTGIYYITPIYSSCPIPVFCDMDTPPGGWIVFQRREDGSENFNRAWKTYRDGFGDLSGEFWLGNDNLFLLSNQFPYQLRVDLWDFYGSRVYAEYLNFKIDGERDHYRLHIDNHTGTAPDGLGNHDQVPFSTPDADHDMWPHYHCANEWAAGWWFNNCWFVILNGPYYNHTDIKYRGISWNDWKAEQLMKVEMKIRPRVIPNH